MGPKDVDGMANSVDREQSSLFCVYTVCPNRPVRKHRNITVHNFFEFTKVDGEMSDRVL